MRIYTEVNFEWDESQGKLVEVSSESFDYSGEIHYAGSWETFDIGYDDYGNYYVGRAWKSWGKFREYEVQKKSSKGAESSETFIPREDIDYQHGGGVLALMLTKVKKNVSFSGEEDHTNTLWPTSDAWQENYKNKTNLEANIDTGVNENIYVKAVGGNYQFHKESNEWVTNKEYELLTGEPVEETGDFSEKQVSEDKLSTDASRAITEVTLAGFIENWKKLTTVGEFDTVEQEVNTWVSDLEGKEQDVKDAYIDLFGAQGTLYDLQDIYNKEVAQGETDFLRDMKTYKTDEEEGLETAITGREGELETLRGEAKAEIRAADAKIGAAGFASTGVGMSARDMLSKEIGKASRGIDEKMTEVISDVKREYLQQTDPLKEKFEPGEGTAYKDYKEKRDLAAKGQLSAWKSATTAYKGAEKLYQEKIKQAPEMLRTELGDIGLKMTEVILAQREGMGGAYEEDPDFNPFETGGYLEAWSPVEFGLREQDFVFTGVGDEFLTDPFYTPYEAAEDLELYDPEKSLEDLGFDWERPEDE